MPLWLIFLKDCLVDHLQQDCLVDLPQDCLVDLPQDTAGSIHYDYTYIAENLGCSYAWDYNECKGVDNNGYLIYNFS